MTTVIYFTSNIFTLLLGTRGALFALALALWYVAGLKSKHKRKLAVLASLVIALILVGDVIQTFREDSSSLSQYTFAPIKFVMLQGSSIEVTETAVRYRSIFSPYAIYYLIHELQNAFVASDVTNYFRGKSLAFDVPVLLDRRAFNLGHGTGASYVAEAYVIGGIAGVAIVSVLIGVGLRCLYYLSNNVLSLIIVALILPDVLIMPRGNLLDWLSVLLKYAILLLILYTGWLLFGFIVWLKKAKA
jgi:oligosaccharide repeat unit polymerase